MADAQATGPAGHAETDGPHEPHRVEQKAARQTHAEPEQVAEQECEPETDDVAILMLFYAEHEPEFANQHKINRILRAYRNKAIKADRAAEWRELMYRAIAQQRGEDPRAHWQRVGGAPAASLTSDAEASSTNYPTVASAASPSVVSALSKDPRRARERPPVRHPRTRPRHSKSTVAAAVTSAGSQREAERVEGARRDTLS